MRKLGLIGFPLGHSFSKKYYLQKFEKEHIKGIDYDLYPLEHINSFPQLYKDDNRFYGFNVTIPHKKQIIPFLDDLSPEAMAIGAVNCIRIEWTGNKASLTGYNTDAFGFENSLKPLLREQHKTALVLGNGGATKAVSYTLKKLGIAYKIVSRTPQNGDLTYTDLSEHIISEHTLLINCSPVGTFPQVEDAPKIPYAAIGKQHLLYDLIYNPEETRFLQLGRALGAATKNGLEMLTLQAERNWQIWNQ